MRSWRLSRALDTLRDEVNAAHPGRSTRSDGTIGDTAHAGRTSDHNPIGGIVHAWDCTSEGWTGAFVEWLRACRDPRIKYVIYRGRMFLSYGTRAWQWRPYSGTNKHFTHAHISVYGDDGRPWGYSPDVTPRGGLTMRIDKTSPAAHVASLQARLHKRGHLGGTAAEAVDGKWGPATSAALKLWQAELHAPADGEAFDEDDMLGWIVHEVLPAAHAGGGGPVDAPIVDGATVTLNVV